jgi:hypothetical protein
MVTSLAVFVQSMHMERHELLLQCFFCLRMRIVSSGLSKHLRIYSVVVHQRFFSQTKTWPWDLPLLPFGASLFISFAHSTFGRISGSTSSHCLGRRRLLNGARLPSAGWKLFKNSNTTANESFDSDWRSFAAYIKENGNMEKFDSNKKTWLEGLKDLAPKWAACYTWQQQTYGIHSTQRAEAANSAIATFCSKNSKILTITKGLEQLADTQGLESEVDKIQKTIFHDVTEKDLGPLAMFLTKGLHPWAKRLVGGQDDQKVHYQCNEVPGKVGVFWVEHMVADLTCFTTKEEQKELE